jgi:hypothetical protein
MKILKKWKEKLVKILKKKKDEVEIWREDLRL